MGFSNSLGCNTKCCRNDGEVILHSHHLEGMEENVDFGQLHQSFGPSVETMEGTSAAGSPCALNNGPSVSYPLAAPVALDKETYAPGVDTEESKLALQSHQEAISLQFKSETNVPNREEMTRAKEEAREAAQLKVPSAGMVGLSSF